MGDDGLTIEHLVNRTAFYVRYLGRLGWYWVRTPWPIWLGPVGALALGVFAFVAPWHEAEPRIRWTGTALQLAGLLLTAVGIAQTRKDFDLPWSPLSIVRKWFADAPKLKVSGAINIGLGGVTMKGLGGHVRVGPGADWSVDKKFEWVMEQVDQLEQRITASVALVADTAAAHLATERSERMAEDTKLHGRLKLSATGGLNLSFVGLSWLVIGTVLVGFSIELARALGRAA